MFWILKHTYVQKHVSGALGPTYPMYDPDNAIIFHRYQRSSESISASEDMFRSVLDHVKLIRHVQWNVDDEPWQAIQHHASRTVRRTFQEGILSMNCYCCCILFLECYCLQSAWGFGNILVIYFSVWNKKIIVSFTTSMTKTYSLR